MNHRILIINGAPRGYGNTDIIVKKIIESSQESGVNIKQIELRKKRIADCIGCYQCYKEDKCSIKDDMINIHDEIIKSDLLIFASPLYWWGVTGLMKTFIDRLYFYYHSTNGQLISGKKGIVVTTMAVTDVETEAKQLIEFYSLLFRRLKIQLMEMTCPPKSDPVIILGSKGGFHG
jgi:multimeric flavodoxin WrbA